MKYNLNEKRKLPLWLKLGIKLSIVPAIIYLFIFLLEFFYLTIENITSPIAITQIFLSIIFLLIYIFLLLLLLLSIPLLVTSLNNELFFTSSGELSGPTFLGEMIIILIWFLIGALIGFIIERGKRRRNNEK